MLFAESSDLVQLAQIMTPLVALWIGYRVEVLRSRQLDTTKKVESVKQDVAVVKRATDGMQDRLLTYTAKENFDAGAQSEIDKRPHP